MLEPFSISLVFSPLSLSHSEFAGEQIRRYLIYISEDEQLTVLVPSLMRENSARAKITRETLENKDAIACCVCVYRSERAWKIELHSKIQRELWHLSFAQYVPFRKLESREKFANFPRNKKLVSQ